MPVLLDVPEGFRGVAARVLEQRPGDERWAENLRVLDPPRMLERARSYTGALLETTRDQDDDNDQLYLSWGIFRGLST